MTSRWRGDLAEADLLLVRHARPQLRSGVPAREWELEHEAAAACAALAAEVTRLLDGTGRNVAGVWTSTEPKAVQTAEALAAVWGVEVVARHEGLDEQRRGVLPLMGDLEWHEAVARLFAEPDELVLGEETARQARDRFAAAVAEAATWTPGSGLTAVSSHGTVITLLLAEANGLDPVQLWSSLNMPDALFVASDGFRLLGRAWPGTP